MSTIKLVIVGASGVGKTSFRVKYISGRFSTGYRPTIGVDFISKTIPNPVYPDEGLVLQIWDTAGQERFSSLSTAFFRGADAAILMYDVNDPSSLYALRKWWRDFCDYAPVKDEERGKFCCVVVGNKVDVAGEESEEEGEDESQRGVGVRSGDRKRRKGRVTREEAIRFLRELVPPDDDHSEVEDNEEDLSASQVTVMPPLDDSSLPPPPLTTTTRIYPKIFAFSGGLLERVGLLSSATSSSTSVTTASSLSVSDTAAGDPATTTTTTTTTIIPKFMIPGFATNHKTKDTNGNDSSFTSLPHPHSSLPPSATTTSASQSLKNLSSTRRSIQILNSPVRAKYGSTATSTTSASTSGYVTAAASTSSTTPTQPNHHHISTSSLSLNRARSHPHSLSRSFYTGTMTSRHSGVSGMSIYHTPDASVGSFSDHGYRSGGSVSGYGTETEGEGDGEWYDARTDVSGSESWRGRRSGSGRGLFGSRVVSRSGSRGVLSGASRSVSRNGNRSGIGVVDGHWDGGGEEEEERIPRPRRVASLATLTNVTVLGELTMGSSTKPTPPPLAIVTTSSGGSTSTTTSTTPSSTTVTTATTTTTTSLGEGDDDRDTDDFGRTKEKERGSGDDSESSGSAVTITPARLLWASSSSSLAVNAIAGGSGNGHVKSGSSSKDGLGSGGSMISRYYTAREGSLDSGSGSGGLRYSTSHSVTPGTTRLASAYLDAKSNSHSHSHSTLNIARVQPSKSNYHSLSKSTSNSTSNSETNMKTNSLDAYHSPFGPALFFASAKMGVNVEEVFEFVARRVVDRWEEEGDGVGMGAGAGDGRESMASGGGARGRGRGGERGGNGNANGNVELRSGSAMAAGGVEGRGGEGGGCSGTRCAT
ncbi:hypothetical protein CVT24_006560 [Panaeolus cyanescens]|uniref:Ras-domain-containing protein n=1 Tax=Panaeolus cyanescens TaxID=181874 RepID=A0A409WNP5_9AGAR|nr:hypothetical protein CVT24_006560 [Panaeolus cyanescens]